MDTNDNPQGLLLQFFKEWRQAQQRLQMAVQTVQGAQADVLTKEARFKGAAELVYGPDATWEYTEQMGLRFSRPNHDTRRALAKARRRKK